MTRNLLNVNVTIFGSALLLLMPVVAGGVMAETRPDAVGDREPEVAQCAEAGGFWLGSASTEHPAYIPAGRCVVLSLSSELPQDREAVCASYGGFWLPDSGDGISACAYRTPRMSD